MVRNVESIRPAPRPADPNYRELPQTYRGHLHLSKSPWIQPKQNYRIIELPHTHLGARSATNHPAQLHDITSRRRHTLLPLGVVLPIFYLLFAIFSSPVAPVVWCSSTMCGIAT